MTPVSTSSCLCDPGWSAYNFWSSRKGRRVASRISGTTHTYTHAVLPGGTGDLFSCPPSLLFRRHTFFAFFAGQLGLSPLIVPKCAPKCRNARMPECRYPPHPPQQKTKQNKTPLFVLFALVYVCVCLCCDVIASKRSLCSSGCSRTLGFTPSCKTSKRRVNRPREV